MENIIKAGTKLYINLSVGIVGMDAHEFYITTKDVSEDTLHDFIHQLALDNAEMYGYYPPDQADADFADEDADGWYSDKTSENIEGYFEIYDEDEHSGHSMGGVPTFQEF